MAAPQPDINTILRMLGDAQRQPATASAQGHPGALQHMPAQGAGYPTSYGAPVPAPNYAFPQPAVSGSYDLNAMRGGNPGAGSVADAIAKAKAYATEKGFTPYERPPGASYPPADPYAVRDSDGTRPGYRRSRSRSPGPRRADPYRDNVNPYRDERRAADYPARDNYAGRDRSQSPGPRNGGRFSPRNGPRERSPMRKEDNSELMDIEANLVGLVIGRQGENLRRVEGETGCRVQFINPATPNNNEPPPPLLGWLVDRLLLALIHTHLGADMRITAGFTIRAYTSKLSHPMPLPSRLGPTRDPNAVRCRHNELRTYVEKHAVHGPATPPIPSDPSATWSSGNARLLF